MDVRVPQSAIAVGSDTLREFVSAGLDGITLWSWDPGRSSVTNHLVTTSNLKIYPSPCFDRAEILINLSQSEEVSLSILDMLGNKRLDVYNGLAAAGEFRIPFNVLPLPNGIYFLVMRSSHGLEEMKFSVLR